MLVRIWRNENSHTLLAARINWNYYQGEQFSNKQINWRGFHPKAQRLSMKFFSVHKQTQAGTPTAALLTLAKPQTLAFIHSVPENIQCTLKWSWSKATLFATSLNLSALLSLVWAMWKHHPTPTQTCVWWIIYCGLDNHIPSCHEKCCLYGIIWDN